MKPQILAEPAPARPPRGRIGFDTAQRVAEHRLHSVEFGVAEWAEALGFAPNYLTRWVQQQAGVNPSQYLRQLRLEPP